MKFLFFVGFNHEVLAQLLGWKSHNSQKTNQLPGSLRFLTKLRREIKNAIVRRSFHRKKQIMKRGYNFFFFLFCHRRHHLPADPTSGLGNLRACCLNYSKKNKVDNWKIFGILVQITSFKKQKTFSDQRQKKHKFISAGR